MNFPDIFVDDLRSKLVDHELHVMKFDDPDIDNIIKDIDILISWGGGLDTDVLDRAINLKLLQIPWIGFDGLNFEYFIRRDIAVCNSKWNPDIVAEYTLGLLMAGIKKFVPMHNSFATGRWESRAWGSAIIRDKTVLLVGYGDIGRSLAKMLKGFGCETIALRRESEIDEYVSEAITWEQYAEYAPQVDYVLISLPLTPETRGVIDESRLRMLKRGCYLVNVGRGLTVDEEALYNVLKDGHLSGAAIDVWYNYNTKREPEPFYPSIFPFHELDNVIMSPHRASSIYDGREIIWDDLLENIGRLENGEGLKNRIDLKRGY